MHGFGFSQVSLLTHCHGRAQSWFLRKQRGRHSVLLLIPRGVTGPALPRPTLPIEFPCPPTPTSLVFLSHDHMGFWGRCLSLSLEKACKSTCGEQIVP